MEIEVLRLAQVREAVGLSARTIRRLEQAGQFPRRRRLSAKAVGWLRAEIDEWVTTREVARSRKAEV